MQCEELSVLLDGGCVLRPHLLLERKTLLNVPVMGRSGHERKYILTRLLRFSDILVLKGLQR